MKKAKIMLTAVSLFAIIGGALAFKVRQENTFYKKTTGACNVVTVLNATTTNAGGQLVSLRVSPTTATTCGTIRTIAIP